MFHTCICYEKSSTSFFNQQGRLQVKTIKDKSRKIHANLLQLNMSLPWTLVTNVRRFKVTLKHYRKKNRSKIFFHGNS